MAPSDGGAAAAGHDDEDCAYSPHVGCMCGLYGRFRQVKIGWQTDGLTVVSTEYEQGTIWATVYSGAPLTAADQGYLDGLADVEAEAVHVWTAPGPAVSRMHFYGVLSP